MSFIETPRFPVGISYGSVGGPAYRTSVIEIKSGQEKRNVDWEYPRHEYDVAYGVKTQDDLETLIDFFHAVRGRAHGFRYKDWADYKSCHTGESIVSTDQSLGTGDGSTITFQLVKAYTKGSLTMSRTISKPVSGTTVVALDSVLQSSGWSIDTATGVITFAQSTWAIVAVDTGTDVVEVSGDKTGDVSAADSIEISGSTGNDGVYTVQSVTYNGGSGRTEITVTEDITDATADGDVLHGQPNNGVAVTAGFEFDVPVRFDTDKLSVVLENYEAAGAEVPIIEIRV